jgi:nucleotide-binding universal stress UspA family protein
MPALRSILAPTDLTDASATTIEIARALAVRFGATLHVLYVASPADLAPEALSGPPAILPRVVSTIDLESVARRHLDQFLALRAQWADAAMQPHAAVGGIVPEILDFARRHDIDLIVMGSRTHGLAQRLFRGSISESILERTQCPVLLVPQGDHAHAT